MENDCIYLVNDGSSTSGGCCKCYCSCPYFIRDNMDLGCGGCCYETPDTEEDNEYKEGDHNEENKE